MFQLAPNPGSRAARRIEEPDARADERRRVVLLSRERVEIARSVDGVFMRIALRPDAYAGVSLSIAGLDKSGFRYEVRLIHRDPDFNVLLARSYNNDEAQAAWSGWARFVGLPTLAERIEGVYEPARPMAPSARPVGPDLRRRRRGVGARRPRFLTRRKIGRPSACAPVVSERELFPGWRLDA